MARQTEEGANPAPSESAPNPQGGQPVEPGTVAPAVPVQVPLQETTKGFGSSEGLQPPKDTVMVHIPDSKKG